jgi:hypothetical protein
MNPIGAKVIPPPQTLAGDHGIPAHAVPAAEDSLQLRPRPTGGEPLGDVDGVPDQVIQPLAEISVGDAALPPPAQAVQVMQEMKVTQLEHPPVCARDPWDPPQIVRNQGPNPRSHLGRNLGQRPAPLPLGFATRPQGRIQEDRVILLAGLEAHQIHHPGLPLEPKPQPVDDEDQLARRPATRARPCDKRDQGLSHAMRHGLGRQPVAVAQLRDGTPLEDDLFQELIARTGPRAAPPAPPDAPGPATTSTLAPTTAEPSDAGVATRRFRMPRIVTHELSARPRLDFLS